MAAVGPSSSVRSIASTEPTQSLIKGKAEHVISIWLGGGMGHVMAQWLVDGSPPIDLTEVAVDRTHEYQATRQFRAERTVERLGMLLNDASWPN